MKKLLNLIALGLVSALLVGCMRDGKDGVTVIGRDGQSVKGDTGKDGRDALGAGAGAGAGAVTTVASNDLILKDLTGGKFLTITSYGVSADTGGAAGGNAGTVAGQALSAVNDKIKLQAANDGMGFVRVWSSKHTLRAAGADTAADPTVSGAGSPIAGVFNQIGGLLGNILYINAKGGAGGAPTANAVFTTAVAGSTGITFLTREVLANGTVRGRCEAEASQIDDFSAATPAEKAVKVPCLYTIN